MREIQQNQGTLKAGTEMDLRLFLEIMYKWRKLIVLSTSMIAVLAALLSFFVLSPVYEAKSLLMVTVASEKLQAQTTVTRQVSQTSQGTSVTNIGPMPVLTMNTYLGQLKSEEVMKRVLATNKLPDYSIPQLSEMIEAKIVEDSNLIELVVTNRDPVLAATIANTVSEQYLKLMDEMMFSSVVVISPANTPLEPVKPKKVLNIIVGFILGLTLSTLLAYFLEYLDNTFKNADDVNRILNLPVLALIPAANQRNTKQNSYGG